MFACHFVCDGHVKTNTISIVIAHAGNHGIITALQ